MGGSAGDSGPSPLSKTVDQVNSTVTAEPLPPASGDEFNFVLDLCEFPVIVWAPPEGRIDLANEAAAELFNVPLEELVGEPVFEYFEPREAVVQAAGILMSGQADGISGRRLVTRKQLGRVPVQFWTRVIDLDGQRRIVALFLPSGELDKPGRDPVRPWRELIPIAVGLADGEWRIVEVSADIANVVGLGPELLIGTELLRLFNPDDVRAIRDRVPRAVDLRHVRLSNHGGDEDEVSLMVAPCGVKPGSIIFAIVGALKCDEELRADRVVDLEMRLRRIAAEVRAAGVLEALDALPLIEEHPKLGELTTRQWEVLSLLLQGQRVPTIASTLYVSQSTVRNHLASIFQKFGVHSQPELLALLAPRPAPDRG